MGILADIQELAITKKTPKLRTGQTVRVHQRIKEGEKERIQIFEGLIIKLNSGHGADKTFTVRKVTGGIGVEKTYPIYSTNIEKIEIKKKSKVRRAKLYYMRERFGKSARLKETFISSNDSDMEGPDEVVEEVFEEAEMVSPEEAQLAAETPETELEEATETNEEVVEEEAPEAEEATPEETVEEGEKKEEA